MAVGSSARELSRGWEYRKGLAMLLVLFCAYAAAATAIGLNRPYWGDEAHFVETVRQFGAGLTLDTIQHYDEMSGPLPFMLYAFWGRVFGFETHTLRTLSTVLAIATYLLLYDLAFSILRDGRPALAATLVVALNPYLFAFSTFVFTDMAAMLFLVLACRGVKNINPALFLVSAAADLLCRQYLVFLVAAAGVYFALRWLWLRGADRRRAAWMLGAAGLACLPLLALFVLWRGPNPDNTLQRLYVDETFRFHPNSLTLYVLLLNVYLVPLVPVLRSAIVRPRVLVVTLAVGWLYWLFPIQPSQVSVVEDINTVGIFHRALRFVVGTGIEQWILFPLFLAGLALAIVLLGDTWSRWQQRDSGLTLFFALALLAFFAIMPFSYLGWEKYFLPAIPVAALWMLMVARDTTPASPAPRSTSPPHPTR